MNLSCELQFGLVCPTLREVTDRCLLRIHFIIKLSYSYWGWTTCSHSVYFYLLALQMLYPPGFLILFLTSVHAPWIVMWVLGSLLMGFWIHKWLLWSSVSSTPRLLWSSVSSTYGFSWVSWVFHEFLVLFSHYFSILLYFFVYLLTSPQPSLELPFHGSLLEDFFIRIDLLCRTSNHRFHSWFYFTKVSFTYSRPSWPPKWSADEHWPYDNPASLCSVWNPFSP